MKQNLLKTLILFWLCLSIPFFGGDWNPGVPLTTPREGAASVVMGDYIYVFGGKTLNSTILNTVERFDINSGIWDTSVASFTIPRMNAAAIMHNGKIFLTGGRNSQSGESIAKVEIYDPAQNSWQPAQDMRKEREGHALVFFDNHVHAFGGAKDQTHLVDDIEWYNDANGEWQEAAFQIASERAAFFYAVVRDSFYMCGGFYYGPTKDSYIKPAGTLSWIQGPDMAGPRAGGASALLDDRLFMFGGITDLSVITDVVEIYDIYNRQIIPGLSMPTARMGMTAVTHNDRIYVIGGTTSQSGPPTDLVEIYDEMTGIDPFADSDRIIKSAQMVGYPNPFNGRINLEFQIPKSGPAELTIFDIQGRMIKTLVNDALVEGIYRMSWDGKDIQNRQVASGIYFAILRGDSFYQTFKMFYVK